MNVQYGWDRLIEGPIDADVHVAMTGTDSNPGTRDLPVRSLQRGVDRLAALGKGSMAIHAGVYREQISLDALQGQPNPQGAAAFRIHRYGRDAVTVSAAEPATGWTLAGQEQLAPLGFAANDVYYLDVPLADIKHGDPFALNLHENGVWCPLARRAAAGARPERLFDRDQFLRGLFATEGSKNLIRAIRAPELVGADPSQVLQSRFQIYGAPNIVATATPDRFEPATGTAFFPASFQLPLQVTNKTPRALFAVQNLPVSLKPGEWAFRQHTGGIRIFFCPRNADAIDSSVEMSLRETCINFGRATGVELYGIEAVRAAGAGRLGGICIIRERQAYTGLADLRLTHCRAGENLCSTGQGYGAVFLADLSGVSLQSCSIGPCQGSYGLFLSGCKDADMRNLHVAGVSKSPCRFYGLQNAIFAFSQLQDSGWDAHANKFNFYIGSDLVLVYGIKTINTGGYATYQRASRIFFGFCELDCDPESQNRALVSQNLSIARSKDKADGTGELFSGGTFWYWNLSLVPRQGFGKAGNSLSLGPGDSTQRHAFHNCRLHGGGMSDIYTRGASATLEQRSHNVYTALAFWQSGRYRWRLGAGEMVGHAAGAGKDMRPIIEAEIAPFFPTFKDWDRDLNGNLVNWQAAPVGAQV
jgi:hypothetical protein